VIVFDSAVNLGATVIVSLAGAGACRDPERARLASSRAEMAASIGSAGAPTLRRLLAQGPASAVRELMSGGIGPFG